MREADRDHEPQPAAKRHWRTPQLRVYGDVGELTANAGTSGNPDGGTTMIGPYTIDLKST